MADVTVSLAGEKRDFYVYIWYRAGGVPCYIGKGQGPRWRDHVKCAKNPWLKRIFAHEGDVMRAERITGLAESEAFELERFLIAEIGRRRNGGTLVNLTDGGEGISGWTHSSETRKKLSLDRKGKPTPWRKGIKLNISVEGRAKMSATHKGVKHSDETRKKMSEAHTGKIKSQEWLKNVSIALTGRKLSEEHVSNLRGKKRTLEQRERISRATRLAMQDPQVLAVCRTPRSDEVRRKMSVSAGLRAATPEGRVHILRAAKLGGATHKASTMSPTQQDLFE